MELVQAKCIIHRDSSSSSSSNSIISFSTTIDRAELSGEETDSDSDLEKTRIYGDSTIFSIENKALDTRMTLQSVLNCPIEYICKRPPLLALKNYCFVINGDLIDVQQIIENSKSWWKQTSSRVRYYLSKELKTFHEVDALLCRGEIRCAYMRRGRAACIESVPLEKIFRISREYGHWKTCISFHRIISYISPVTESAIEFYGFQKRIFLQYLWRTTRHEEKRRVVREYRKSKIPISSTMKIDRLKVGSSLPIISDVSRIRSSISSLTTVTTILDHHHGFRRFGPQPSRIPQIQKSRLNYRRKQALQENLSHNQRRRNYSSIPQLKDARRRIGSKITNAHPEPIHIDRPVSMLNFREQFQKHQQKIKKKKLSSATSLYH